MQSTNTKSTFFVIGWIIEKYPSLIKNIAQYYELGSHTYSHQLVRKHSPKEFEIDLKRSVGLLEDITGKKVKYFRTPGFSITEQQGWAFEILAKQGIEIDCSVFPANTLMVGWLLIPI